MRKRNATSSSLVAFTAVLVLPIHTKVAGQVKRGALLEPDVPQSIWLYVLDRGTLHITNTERFGLKKEEIATTDMSGSCFLE